MIYLHIVFLTNYSWFYFLFQWLNFQPKVSFIVLLLLDFDRNILEKISTQAQYVFLTYKMSGRWPWWTGCDQRHELIHKHFLTLLHLAPVSLWKMRVQPPEPFIHKNWSLGLCHGLQGLFIECESLVTLLSHFKIWRKYRKSLCW